MRFSVAKQVIDFFIVYLFSPECQAIKDRWKVFREVSAQDNMNREQLQSNL